MDERSRQNKLHHLICIKRTHTLVTGSVSLKEPQVVTSLSQASYKIAASMLQAWTIWASLC